MIASKYLFAAALVVIALGDFAFAKTVIATQCGITGDGIALNTGAIQNEINILNAQSGGTLEFPAGRYLTGTIELKSNITLQLDEGAVLLGSANPTDYHNPDPFRAGDGIDLGYALIYADGAAHVRLQGPGTIDGQGVLVKAAQNRYEIRPFLVRWLRCDDIMVSDIHLTAPGSWTLSFFQCQEAIVNHVIIRSHGLANNDGIDMDSCQTMRISNCDIDSGDDAVCLKASSAKPCRDIHVSDCRLSTRCNAIKLGTESLGDFQNIHVERCELRDIGMSAIALYSVDGAHMSSIDISDINVNGAAVPISIRLGGRLKTFRAGDQSRAIGEIRDVSIRDVRAIGARQIGILINGIPSHPVENLTLSNIQIDLPGGGTDEDAKITLPEKESAYPEMSMFGKSMPASGMYLRHIRNLTLHDVHTRTEKTDARPQSSLIDVEHITSDSTASRAPAGGGGTSDRPQ